MTEQSFDFLDTYLTTMRRLEEIPEIYDERSRVVSDIGEAGTLPLDEVLEPRLRLLASLTLIQEGLLIINPVDEGSVELTVSGQKRFIGIKALSKG